MSHIDDRSCRGTTPSSCWRGRLARRSLPAARSSSSQRSRLPSLLFCLRSWSRLPGESFVQMAADMTSYPPGVFNVLNGVGRITGDALARHMDVDKIAFTGSTITGRRIAIAAAESNLKSVTLELGGKSPNIIFEDANLAEAAKWAAFGVYENMGESPLLNCVNKRRRPSQRADLSRPIVQRWFAHSRPGVHLRQVCSSVCRGREGLPGR